MNKCRKCSKSVITCATCRGRGSVGGMFGQCTRCDGTGKVCPDHGKHWH
jgi:RecJ-like exonuclease